MDVSKIRERCVTTIPKHVRKKARIRVGDYLVWTFIGQDQFLVTLAPAERYRALKELLSGVELSSKSKRKAEEEYFRKAGSRVEHASG